MARLKMEPGKAAGRDAPCGALRAGISAARDAGSPAVHAGRPRPACSVQGVHSAQGRPLPCLPEHVELPPLSCQRGWR